VGLISDAGLLAQLTAGKTISKCDGCTTNGNCGDQRVLVVGQAYKPWQHQLDVGTVTATFAASAGRIDAGTNLGNTVVGRFAG